MPNGTFWFGKHKYGMMSMTFKRNIPVDHICFYEFCGLELFTSVILAFTFFLYFKCLFVLFCFFVCLF